MSDVLAQLVAPFQPSEIKWKPQSVKGTRAMAIAYIDARLVQDRLDAVLGVAGWQDEYTILPDGGVVCKLKVLLDGVWLSKMDVGSPSEQPDGGDRMKAAFSDALKRTAVKFGIGRYLYRLKADWVDYDPAKKQIIRPPQLPPWAIPVNTAKVPPPPGGQAKQPDRGQARLPEKKPAEATPPEKKPNPNLPKTGAELVARLAPFDAKFVADGTTVPNAIAEYLLNAGAQHNYPPDLSQWNDPESIQSAGQWGMFFKQLVTGELGEVAATDVWWAGVSRFGADEFALFLQRGGYPPADKIGTLDGGKLQALYNLIVQADPKGMS